jgi:hypothetical protein
MDWIFRGVRKKALLKIHALAIIFIDVKIIV